MQISKFFGSFQCQFWSKYIKRHTVKYTTIIKARFCLASFNTLKNWYCCSSRSDKAYGKSAPDENKRGFPDDDTSPGKSLMSNSNDVDVEYGCFNAGLIRVFIQKLDSHFSSKVSIWMTLSKASKSCLMSFSLGWTTLSTTLTTYCSVGMLYISTARELCNKPTTQKTLQSSTWWLSFQHCPYKDLYPNEAS